ncbi:NAD(+) synthase, partial [Listeria monocytogenes]
MEIRERILADMQVAETIDAHEEIRKSVEF